MLLRIESSHIAIVGSFKLSSNDALGSRLAREGAASVSKHVDGSTTFVAHGTHGTSSRATPSRKIVRAREAGIPVIDETQLRQLLRDGSLEIPDAGLALPGETMRGDSIARARSLLGGEPSSKAWTELVELVDECDPDHLRELVDYLAPQLARWRSDPRLRWNLSDAEASRWSIPADFFVRMPRGYLRAAPPRWLASAVEGDDPRLSLIEHVGLTGLELESTHVLRILGRPALGGLRSLDLGASLVRPSFWRRAPALDALCKLEHLRLARFDEGSLAQLDGDALPALRAFSAGFASRVSKDEVRELMRLPSMESIEELVVESEHAMTLMLDRTLPNVHTLTVTEIGALAALRDREVRERVFPALRRLRLFVGYRFYLNGGVPRTHIDYQALSRVDFSGLEEVDLSGVHVEFGEHGLHRDLLMQRSRLESFLPGSDLVASVERVRLGELATPRFVERLSDFVEVA